VKEINPRIRLLSERGRLRGFGNGGWGGGDGEGCEEATRGACRRRSQTSETRGFLCARCWLETVATTGRDGAPDIRVMVASASRRLLNISPPLDATVMQGAPDPRSLREPLRWDRLSQGQGLFLKQTRPSTNRCLVSESAAKAWSPLHDNGVAGCRQDMPCVQRELGRDPAGGVSTAYAQQVRQLRCVAPYNQQIVTPTLQRGVRGMTPSQDKWGNEVLKGVTDFRSS
jgi:hypothetical protein